jgi:8-oxo-dGTP pyrophosphatase MutT (NUDIX family)
MSPDYDIARPYVAAFVIFRKGGKVAFVLRQNTSWMNGRYGLPAGKVEKGESVKQAAIREAEEETGVKLEPENLKHLLTVYRTSSDDDPEVFWFDVIFEATAWQGELHNAEPDKHAELSWLDPDNLPENVTPYVNFFLEQIKAGHAYAEHGWEQTTN